MCDDDQQDDRDRFDFEVMSERWVEENEPWWTQQDRDREWTEQQGEK